jgi:hypothetical protein
MIRGLPRLERALQRRVLAEVRRSPALWEAYVKRRWARRIKWALEVLPRMVLGPVLAVGVAVILAAVISCLWIGIGLLSKNDTPRPDPAFLLGNGSEIGLLVQAMCLTVLAFAQAGLLRTGLWQSKELADLAYLPIRDTVHLREVIRDLVWGGALTIAYLTSFSYGYWAWSNGFSLGGWIAAAALAVLQGLVASAMAVALQGRFFGMPIWLAIAGLLIAGIAAGIGGCYLRLYLEGCAWIGMILMPAGWVNAAYQYGLVQHNPAGCLWCIPVLPLLLHAWRRLRGPLAIREFIFHPSGSAEAIPDDGSLAFKGKRFFTPLGQPPAIRVQERLSDADALRRIHEAITLGRDNRRRGWLERLILRYLSPRDRAILDCMFVPIYRFFTWTWWWNWTCLAALALLLIALVGEFRQDARELAMLTGIPFMVVLVGPSALIGRMWLRPDCWLPIGEGEVGRLLWKIHLVVMACLGPLFLLLGTAVGWRAYDDPRAGLFVAAIWLYLGIVLFPFRLLLTFGSAAPSDGTGLLWEVPLLISLSCVGTVVVAAICCSFQWQTPWLAASGMIVLPVLSFGSLSFYRRSFKRWRGDWLPSRLPSR